MKHPKNLKRLRIGILITALIVVGFLARQLLLIPRGDAISPTQLKSVIAQESTTLVNVHTPYEGEIEQTDAFIAVPDLAKNQRQLPVAYNTRIIVYDKDGTNGPAALQALKALGYSKVHYLKGGMEAWKKARGTIINLIAIEEEVLPAEGVTLPVSWGTLGKQLVDLGVIDLAAFRKVVNLTPEQEKVLTEGSEEKITIDAASSQFVVDVLWPLGLAQKSLVYTEGPLGTEHKDNAGSFASTGGWNLAKGDALDYLNQYDLIPLTDAQQRQVGDIAQNVYRPCCNASTWFPDCNHGMAALAAIELMVSAGIPEEEIYRSVLALNSFWFPDSYVTLAAFFARQGQSWNELDAKMLLSEQYSSGTGANLIAQRVGPLPFTTAFAGSCGT